MGIVILSDNTTSNYNNSANSHALIGPRQGDKFELSSNVRVNTKAKSPRDIMNIKFGVPSSLKLLVGG
jgi:hypothetical protein